MKRYPMRQPSLLQFLNASSTVQGSGIMGAKAFFSPPSS